MFSLCKHGLFLAFLLAFLGIRKSDNITEELGLHVCPSIDFIFETFKDSIQCSWQYPDVPSRTIYGIGLKNKRNFNPKARMRLGSHALLRGTFQTLEIKV
jgi:hypothetical protein